MAETWAVMEERHEKAKIVNLGTWGAHSGGFWTYEPKGTLSQISITSVEYINSITFTSVDESGNPTSTKFGKDPESGTPTTVEIDIPKDEKLIGLSGTFGPRADAAFLRSLTFYTNKNRPLQTAGNPSIGKAFSYLATNDDSIVGFFGRQGSLVDCIGVYVQPKPSIHVVAWGGTGGLKWNYEPQGLISGITVTWDDEGITSISFRSKNESNEDVQSPVMGIESPQKANITIDTAIEKLSFIGGTFGEHKDSKTPLIHSLTFITDKAGAEIHGPYGDDRKGTAFSLPVQQGYFVGFHGNYGHRLDAIGVHLKSK